MNICLLLCKFITVDIVPVHPVDSVNGEKLAFSYDVIGDYMFNFLEGRLVLNP